LMQCRACPREHTGRGVGEVGGVRKRETYL